MRTSTVSIRAVPRLLFWVGVSVRNGTRANRALALRTAVYERDKITLLSEDLMKFLPVWKKEPDTEWLSEISDVILQQTLRDLGTAFKNFFDSCTGERKGPKMRYPRFKTRNSRKSLRYSRNGFTYENGEIRLAKMKEEPLNIRWS